MPGAGAGGTVVDVKATCLPCLAEVGAIRVFVRPDVYVFGQADAQGPARPASPTWETAALTHSPTAIAFAVAQPPNVEVNELVVRPTAQR